MNILIKNARPLQFYPPKLMDTSDIFIEDGYIKRVGTSLARELKERKIEKEIDGEGKYIAPGNVCSHNHFYSALARGVVAPIPPSHDFVGILKNLWWRLDRALDEPCLYTSGLVGALEAIRAGTTSVIDHNASPFFIRGSLACLKSAFEKCGLRGIVCYEVTDRNTKDQRDRGIEENVEFIKKQETESIRGSVGAHAPFTLSDESLALLAEAVEETRRGIHIHVSEDAYDMSFSHHHYGISPLERLERFNLLNEKSLIIHGVHLLNKEIDILNRHDSFLIHNPRSNMKNGVGYNSRLSGLSNVAIGTDGIGSDMFEETRFGYFKNGDAKGTLTPSDYMRLLYNGNRILERYFDKKFGQIEPGFAADLVILDYMTPTPLMEKNLGGHFIFGLTSAVVETVIINGDVVYENRRFPFELEPIYSQAEKEASRLWKNMAQKR